MADFNPAFDKTLCHEGGYVIDSDDPGGETYKGISRRNWPGWLGWTIIDLIKKRPGFPDSLNTSDAIEIKQQLDYEVRTFYFNEFWKKAKFDLIQSQLVAESVFDFAVNAGLVVSVQLAQQVANVTADGQMGPKTLGAINAMDSRLFVAEFALKKIARYIKICEARPESKKYFYGWVRRAIG